MIYHGDCIEIMRDMPDNSVDTVITDPPYELGFMGKSWDSQGVSFRKGTWEAVYRVAKPGAVLMAFGGTRTWHRIAVAIEDAGWKIRDTIMWVYGSGFPKSLDISKAIDKVAGADREVVGKSVSGKILRANGQNERPYQQGKDRIETDITTPSTDSAKLWNGWGTALKPAWEPIIVAMKSVDRTFAENAAKHGVAGMWIDGGRVGTAPEQRIRHNGSRVQSNNINLAPNAISIPPSTGRFPANLIHDGSDEVVGMFPVSDNYRGNITSKRTNGTAIFGNANNIEHGNPGDSGSAARFFYCAKASRAEREMGCGVSGNRHCTVKPLALTRYLVRLTKTPTGGVVLDPFMGSGTTGMACNLEGREFIGIDMDRESIDIAEKRIEHTRKSPTLFEARS